MHAHARRAVQRRPPELAVLLVDLRATFVQQEAHRLQLRGGRARVSGAAARGAPGGA
jgi:hypothetical protein